MIPSEIFSVLDNLLYKSDIGNDLKFRGKDFNVYSFVIKKAEEEEEEEEEERKGILFQDITERKQAEEKLLVHSTMHRILMEISSTYINLPLDTIKKTIQDSLGRLAQFVDADRCYIFEYDFDKQICKNTYEWCDKDIEPMIETLQAVPLSFMPDWLEKHRKGEVMHVPDVLALPSSVVREILEPQGILSLLAVPLINKGQCCGFVGFDWVRRHHVYSEEEHYLLTLFCNILANVMERIQVEEMLKESEQRHRILFESSNDAIMTLEPPSWGFTSGNPATVKMFKAKNEEEFISYGPGGLSPECQPDGRLSAEKAKQMIEIAMKEGSNFFEWTYRRLDGENFPASVLLTRTEIKGKQILQATVRDITQQKHAENELIEKIKKLEHYEELTVERELRMIELKKKIEGLEKKTKEYFLGE